MRACDDCGTEYDITSRRGKPGKITVCAECAEESVERYSGNMIYSHKTGCSIQINKSRALTDYISRATYLRNKGSNLGNNLKVSGPVRSNDMCISTARADANAKGRADND
jgi:hypothetical protein